MTIPDQVQQRAADLGTATSIGGTAWVWLGHATEIFQFVAIIVSIVAGVASAWYYMSKRRREDRREERDSK